jgi:small subunit ribosomal protein S6
MAGYPCSLFTDKGPLVQKECTNAKATGKNELMYIINPNLTEEETAAVVEKFKALVEEHGTLDEMELMGKRWLATKSTISLGLLRPRQVHIRPRFSEELDRILGITDSVIRSLITVRYE